MSTPTLPPDVTYSRFHGTFLLARQDGPDAGTRPDPGFAVGTVTFTPSVERLIVPASGAVIWLEPTYSSPIAADGTFELEVPATDAEGVIPTEWTYDVSVNVTGKKPWVFTTNAPAGADRNILQAVTFPSTQGTLITRGDPGRGIESVDDQDGDGVATVTYTDGATTGLPLPIGPQGGESGAEVVYVSKGYYSVPGGYSTNPEAFAVAVGRVYLSPVYLPAGVYDQIAFRVKTGGTSLFNVGVYAANTREQIAVTTSAIIDTTAQVHLSMDPFTIPRSGGYLLAFVPSGDTTTLPQLTRHGWPTTGDVPVSNDFQYTPGGGLWFSSPDGSLPAVLPAALGVTNGRIMARVRAA